MANATPGRTTSRPRLAQTSFADAGTMSAAELFELRVTETPAAIALRTVRGDLTFGEWHWHAAAARECLGQLGALRNERVALWMTNDDASVFVSAFQATLSAAAIAVSLDDRLAVPEANTILAECEPRALILSALVAQRLGEEGLRDLGISDTADALRGPTDAIMLPLSHGRPSGTPVAWEDTHAASEAASIARPHDNGMIGYTSGTSGRPKGAIWPQGALCQYAERVAHATYADPRGGRRLGESDVLQSPIPLYTTASIIENLYPAVFAGCMLVYEGRRFDPAASEARIVSCRTTVYNGVPPHFALMCELPPRHGHAPELIVTSGSPITPALYRRMRQRWPSSSIANWYGLNESGTGQTINFGVDMDRAPSSIGRPIWPTEIRIVDDEGNSVAAGDRGELWMRAPGQMTEYFRNPEQTAIRLQDGWLRTGDYATIDEQGLIHIVGRDEERINRGGFKFYPSEIEAVLEEHAAVREAAVVGIPHPVLGEDPVAFVVMSSDVTSEELRSHCRARIAANKVPSRIAFRSELPRGAYGKVIRRELVRSYTSGP